MQKKSTHPRKKAQKSTMVLLKALAMIPACLFCVCAEVLKEYLIFVVCCQCH